MVSNENNELTTALRYFDSEDASDMRSLREITSHITKNYGHWMDDVVHLTKADIEDWAEENASDRHYPKLYAVVTKENDAIQGFIYTYPEEDRFALNYLTKNQILSPIESNRLIYEISFARHPSGLKGQITKAIPLACAKLCTSMRVPISKRTGLPHLTVIAYTFPDNIASIRVLDKTGFEKRGAIPEYRGAERMVDVHVLNWLKLLQA